MFKRFLVLDLYHPEYKDEIKEWVDVSEEMPKEESGIYKVMLNDGDQTIAYYCRDQCYHLMSIYKDKPSYWWHKEEKVPLYNVTHWGKR